MNSKSSLVKELQDKDYRHAFVRSQVSIGLPLQCRALRESREWTQPQLAEAAGMSQPRISEIERPGERKLNLETLFRLAEAFDVALQVRFVTFRDFVDSTDGVRLEHFSIKPFEEDLKDLENEEIWGRAKAALSATPNQSGGILSAEDPVRFIKGTPIEMAKGIGVQGALMGGGSQESRVAGL